MNKKIKIALAAVLAACALLNLTGCSEKREPNSGLTDSSNPSSSESKDESNTSETNASNSGNSAETIKTQYAPIKLSGDNTVNSIRLFDAITADKANAMFSPLSLNMALGLIEAGAKGETKAQIDSYLQTENFADFAERYLKYASEQLTKEERIEPWHTYPGSAVEIANSFWADNGLSLKDEYKQRVGGKFDAEIQNVDFGKKTETLDKINGWVNEKTHEMIPTILGDCAEGTAAVLINTVYFESPWYLREWAIDENSKESFTLADGTVKDIPLMYRFGDSYFENSNATAFSCDYSNGTKFIGILPKKSGEFTLEELDIRSLLKSEIYDYDVSAVMPRLKFDSEFVLRDALCAAGIEDIFDSKADFSGISDMPLWVSQILQKTSLELDENGTKASAATAEMLTGGGINIPSVKKTVRLDRPFAFMIYDSANDQILFVGKVTNP